MDELSTRVDEHGKQIIQVGDRLNVQAVRIDGLYRVVLGDKTEQIPGLAQRTSDLEKVVDELQRWRRDMMLVAKIVIVLLGVNGIGTWIPLIKAALVALGV